MSKRPICKNINGKELLQVTTSDIIQSRLYEKKECKTCHSSCYECHSDSSDACLSCPRNKYLLHNFPGSLSGQCLDIKNTTVSISVFVTSNSRSDQADGTYAKPYDHITRALSSGIESLANYSSGSLKIYLLKGKHYMTTRFDKYYYPTSKSNKYSLNYDVTIQPVFWGDTYEGITFESQGGECISSSNQLIVYYKMGNGYYFKVPKSLTIKNIEFDAIDSTIDPSSSWLSQMGEWCRLNDTVLYNVEADSEHSWNVYTLQTHEWLSTIGEGFIKFEFSDTHSQISQVGTLNIELCIFKNFYYDFTSLISPVKGHGHINVVDSIFEGFSNCGSIIRDTREFPIVPGFYKDNQVSSLIKRGAEITIDNYEKCFISPSSQCVSTSCASISVTNCSFSKFNHLKGDQEEVYNVSPSSNMRHYGIIFDLKNYYGTVTIKDNTFDSISMKFENWGIDNLSSFVNDEYLFYDRNVKQNKVLMYFKTHQDVLLIGNNFTSCNGHNSILQFSKRSQDHGILIHQNTFVGNSALDGVSAILLEILTDINYDSNKTIGTNMIWTGVQISDNHFESNVGCETGFGLILAMCGTSSELDANNAQSSSFEEPSKMSTEKSEVTILEEIISFSIVNYHIMDTVIIDLNKFMLMNNTYHKNFIPGSKGLLNLYKIIRLHIQDETYSSNTGIFKEALNLYGSIHSDTSDNTRDSGALNFSSFFDGTGEIATSSSGTKHKFYPNSVLYIQGSIVIDIDGATFDSNYILPPSSLSDAKKEFSETFSFLYCRGYLTINRMNVINLYGIDMSYIRNIIGKKYSHIHEATAFEREISTGDPTISVDFPDYYVNFGVFHPIIKFHDAGDGNLIQKNLFDNVTISNFNLSNVTFYNPRSHHGFITSFTDEFHIVQMTNFTIQNIDCFVWQMPLLLINLKGNFYAENGIFSKISNATGNLNNLSYAPNRGLIQIQSMNEYDASAQSIRSFQNMTFNQIYGGYANVFYFSSDIMEETILQDISVNLKNTIIQNWYSDRHGTIYFETSPMINIYISDSMFLNNYGLTGPADLYIDNAESLTIQSTVFEGFSASKSKGLSITMSSI